MPTRKAIRYSMNSNGTELEQVVHTHRTSYRSRLPRGFGELNPSPHSRILLPSQWIPVLALLIHIYYGANSGSHFIKPIPYLTHHFRERRSADSVTETDLMCEQMPYPVWFSCRRKSCPVCEHGLNGNMFPPRCKGGGEGEGEGGNCGD